MAQAVSHQSVTVQTHVQSEAGLWDLWVWDKMTLGKLFLCEYHSTSTLYAFIHLSETLYVYSKPSLFAGVTF